MIVWLILNPFSGTNNNKAHTVRQIQKAVQENEVIIELQVFFTQYKGHAREIAKRGVIEGIDILWVLGGDGTVHEVIQELAKSHVTLAILPRGSGNGLARSFNIPFHWMSNLDLLRKRRIVDIDLGICNGTYFASNMGIGIDAEVCQLYQNKKNRGLLAYISLIVKSFINIKSFSVSYSDGTSMFRKENIILFHIANSKQLGYGFSFDRTQDLQDNQMGLIALNKLNLFQMAQLSCQLAFGKPASNKNLNFEMINNITISTNKKIMQMDGEYYELHDSTQNISIMHRALKIIIP